MKRAVVLFLLSLHMGITPAQTYQIGKISATFIDSTRNNRSVPVEIYYPADSTGDNLPLTVLNTFRFPVISFGHGFVMTWSAYANVWEAVVPNGYIIIFPKTETGISPSHATFGADLAFCIQRMNVLGTDPASPFHQRIDSMNCVMGHSMGGGAAFLASGLNPSIKAIATLAAAETNPAATAAASTITAPALVIAGENDCVTPPVSNQLPMYNNLISACKTYVSILGGSHCQMANTNSLCNFGEATCTPPPAISRSDQHQVVFRYLLPWLDNVLKFNCNSATVIDSLLLQDTQITYLRNCPPCNITAVNYPSVDNAIEVFPNPFSELINIQLNKIDTEVLLNIYDINGRMLREFKLKNSLSTINLDDLTNGYYFFTLQYNNKITRKSILKL